MSENTTEVIVGGLVLAVAGFFLFFAGQTTGYGSTSSAQYELSASFRSAEGVTLGTDVRLAGVKVGSVTAMELNPQTFRADIKFSIAEEIQLPDDSSVLVSSEGLLGGTYVELQPGGSLFNLEPGAEVEDTQGAVSLISLLLKFASGNGE